MITISGSFIIFLLLLFINLLFIIRSTPIIAIPFGIFTFYMVATVFFQDSTIFLNPYTSFILLMFSAICVLVNGLSLKDTT